MNDLAVKKDNLNEILIVDDSLTSLKLLNRILTERGYRVRQASSGKPALKSVEAQRPDLILLDIDMPDMNGYQVCRHLKSNNETKHIPVIFISAHDEAEKKIEGFRAGGVDYISKPFEREEIVARVEIQLRLKELTERLEQQVNQRTKQLQQEITERIRAEEILREKYFIIESASSVIATSDLDGAMTYVNPAFLTTWGYEDVNEIYGRPFWDFWIVEDRLDEIMTTLKSKNIWSDELNARKKDGTIFHVHVLAAAVINKAGEPIGLMSTSVDITKRKQVDMLLNLRVTLMQYSATHSLEELLVKTLDEVEKVTQSPVSFYHFVNPDQKTLSLQAWSTRTVSEFCKAEGKGLHYSIEQAGVWVDCIRQRKTIIHNDYESLPHKKGLPPGHTPVKREMVVPIFRGDKIVAILGVGNKFSAYTEDDARLISYCADIAWEMAERKLAEEDRRSQIYFLKTLQQINDAIQKDTTTNNILRSIMSVTLSALNCDRAWIYPLESPFGEIKFAHAANPEFPGADRLGTYLDPPGPGELKEYQDLIESEEPIAYIVGTERPVINENALRHHVKSQIVMALSPNLGGLYIFGLHQCSHPRVWTKPEEELFKQIGHRVSDYLNSWLAHMDLQKSEDRFRAVANYTYDWETWFNSEGRAEWINPGVERITGYSVRECLSMQDYPLSIVYEKDQPLVLNIIKEAQQGGSGNDKPFRVKMKSGSIRWVAISWQPIFNKEGKSLGYRSSIRDITDRKLAEEELRKYQEHLAELVNERTAELATAKADAEAANAAKSEFLARMSHEIRTPLNAVTGLTNIVLKSKLTAEQRDYLNKVQIASNNLLEVINDILDFSRIEAGRLELKHTPFDLDQMLEKLADLFSNRVAQKDIELIFNIDQRVPRQLTGDAGRVTQVLTNLIENAVKFTEAGEIVVNVKSDKHADKRTGLTAIQFQVSDTGLGIAPDVLPTLFDPFTQADGYLTRKHEGTGLGLAICKRIVELMGGEIEAESTPGKGSTFSFTVMTETQAKEKSHLKMPGDLHGLKTLVVDDSTTARQMLVDLLESFTFSITDVESGEKALEVLQQTDQEDPYRLVLLDWKMPGMDGLETAKHIRALKYKKNDPSSGDASPLPATQPAPIIIMVTAYGHEWVQKQIDSTPIDKLLLKPIKSSALFNTIIELLYRTSEAIPSREKRPIISPIQQLSDKLVLVVEDSELNRDVAVALLEAAGMRVETAENGRVAVDMVTGSTEGYYDAVIMDIQMPLMDGYEATRRIREWEARTRSTDHRSPIIALTAHALKGEKQKCLDAGMDDYLAKPIDELEMHRVLLKWISSQQS